VQGGDLMLVSEPARDCMLQQVRAGFVGGTADLMELGGTYTAATVNALALASYTFSAAPAEVTSLGNPDGRPPRLQFIGRRDNGLLVSYDLLRFNGNDAPDVMGEGVLELRALYGIAVGNDTFVSQWVSPRDPAFSAATLGNGSPASQQVLRRILAVRIGMVVRGDLLERNAVSPAELSLFANLPAHTVVRALSADEQRFRVAAYEFTVPMINPMSGLR
jgi:type IV pilus assembly protein PilW